MKKNNILRILGIGIIAGSIALFAACSNTQTSDTPLNQASGKAETTQAAESSISLDAAIDIALEHANISRDSARFTKTHLDNDDAVPNYEIEFIADGIEYEYEVAVSSGEILKSKTENANYNEVTTQPAEVSNSNPVKETTTKAQNLGYISVDGAKAAALSDARVKEADAVFEKAEFDGDDLIPHYDIEFYYDGYEYDYEINAQSAAVIEKSKEKERSVKSPTQASEYIGEEAAKQAAYGHAEVAAADVKRCEIDLDRDDIIPHYELEFVAGSYEYEYEINAKTGAVIASEKDYND